MSTTQPLTPAHIHRVLSARDRAAVPSPDYCRLVEIYCVVKAGGVAVQVAVAERLAAQERAPLLAEIQTLADQGNCDSRVQALRQEVQELQRSIAHRLEYLSSIHPEEEASVRQCLGAIEAHFQTQGGDRP